MVFLVVISTKTFAAGNTAFNTLVNDYRHFYSSERLLRLGVGFGIGAISAHSNIDYLVRENYQKHLHSKATDDAARVFKYFGERKYLLPITALSASMRYIQPDSHLAAWGLYSIRAYITGAPAMVVMQRATGGSRPGETSHKSRWRPFSDDNGVSGHSYFGAVPFLTIARMNGHKPGIKYLAIAASTATAFSRINDDAHFLSQAALGWYMAWETVDAVFDAEKQAGGFSVVPVMNSDIYGIAAHYEW